MLECLKEFKVKIKCRRETQGQDQELVREQDQEEWDHKDQLADQDQEQVLEELGFRIKEIFQIINKT